MSSTGSPEENPWNSEIPIKISQANSDHVEGIFDIYSYYMQESIMTGMYSTAQSTGMIFDLQLLEQRGLPFLVALSDDTTAAHVLGYAYLAPFGGQALSYISTVEVFVYVHPEYTGRGIGTCLLHGIFAEVNLGEGLVHRGFEKYVKAPLAHMEFERGFVRNIIAGVPVETEGDEEEEWLVQWLEKFGFVEKGRLHEVGCKLAKWYV